MRKLMMILLAVIVLLGFQNNEKEALYKEAFAYWNIDMKYMVDAGDFIIMTGTSSLDKGLKKIVLTVVN